MCGIVGIIDPSSSRDELRNILQSMNDSIVHRGPDDEGYFVTDGVGVAMRRLSIIDLSGGHQPISNEDGRITLVCNGEIYNYQELAQQLRDRGHHFKTESDVEVILHLYEEMGDRCLDELRGMYAFAIWDEYKQRLLVARDRMGIKPLYFARQNGRLVFASEIKAILEHPAINATPNSEGIASYLSVKYVCSPQTMFDGIESLPPAHKLVSDADGIKIDEYWDYSFQGEKQYRSEADAIDELDHLLNEAVRLRLRADVPFGAFLSGGVDSSTIVALMSRMLDEPVKTFSVGFENTAKQADELPYARQVSQQYGTDHREFMMSPQYFREMAEKVTWHLDQPIADQATLAMYAVSDLASQHVKMVLTGEGGDELFAGYARYYGERYAKMFRWTPGPLKSLAWKTLSKMSGRRRHKIAMFALIQQNETARFTNWFPLFNSEMMAQLVNGNQASITDRPAFDAFGAQLGKTDASHFVNRMLYVDSKLWLPDFLLMRGDKMSMGNSLEARVPMLDHKLVEFAATLPADMKVKGMVQKYLLKQVGRRYLPDSIIDRKKEGFPIPISDWFRDSMKTWVRDMLSPETIRRRGLFNSDYVTRLVEQHESGFADHGALIWGLVSLEIWHQIFIDSSVSKTKARREPIVVS